MKKIKTLICILSLTLIGSTASFAGPYTDNLIQCIEKNYTQKDKKVIVQWIFSVLATAPEVKPLTKIDPKLEKKLSKDAADLMTDLYVERCPKEFTKAIKYEPEGAEVSGRWLGEKAMSEILTAKEVQKSLDSFSQFLDKKRFESLEKYMD